MSKRFLLLVLFAAAIVFTACSPQPAVAVQGQWAGTANVAGASVPVGFTVDRDYQVSDSNFHFDYDDGYVSYTVSSEVKGNRLSLLATASSPDGTLTFTLDASVEGNTMTGEYNLRGVDSQSKEFMTVSGSFKATRTD